LKTHALKKNETKKEKKVGKENIFGSIGDARGWF
jgi:hypothetical protein